MKPDIHPDYHEITVVLTDGTKLKTRSTYGKAGDKLQLDVDFKTHPAWNEGGVRVNTKASQVAKFNSKFGSLGQTKSAAATGNTDAQTDKKDKKES